MPFYIRKAFNKGPIRLNLSKGGLGFSVGVKGLRLGTNRRGTYVHMGRHGLYFRERVGGPWGTPDTKSGSKKATNQSAGPYGQPYGQTHQQRHVVDDAVAVSDQSFRPSLDELNGRLHQPGYAGYVFGAFAILGILLAFVSPMVPCLVWLGGVIVAILTYNADQQRRTYPLLYEFEQKEATEWNELNRRLSQLRSCAAMWQVASEANTRDWKRNAGATGLSERHRVILGLGQEPKGIITNIQALSIVCPGLTIYFMPDRLYLFDGRSYGAISYESLRTSVKLVNFVESDGVPQGARVAGHTWRYVNKDGSPDRRYSNNAQLPIVQYSTIDITSAEGLALKFMMSDVQAAQAFAAALAYAAALAAPKGQQSHAKAAPPPPPPPPPQPPRKPPSVPDASLWAFDLLGTEPTCTQAEAASAYREMAKGYHPDRVAHLPSEFRALAEERMREINAAYAEVKRVRGWA